MSVEEKKRLPLAEMLSYVSQEILKANKLARSRPEGIVMKFEECEVEVAFEVELEASGKVNFWAVELGTKGVQTTTHTLKVKYHAIEDFSKIKIEEIVAHVQNT